MIIKILAADNELGNVRVAMLGAELTARWRGGEPPSIGERHAEFDCRPMSWSDVRLVREASHRDEAVSAPDGVFRAEVLDVDHDGVTRLRTQDVEYLVDTVGDPPIGIVGAMIDFSIDGVEIYPYDV